MANLIAIVTIIYAISVVAAVTGLILYSRFQRGHVHHKLGIALCIIGCILAIIGTWASRASLEIPKEMTLQAARVRLAVIGEAFQIYQREYGRYPEHVSDLVDKKLITPHFLRSPFLNSLQSGNSDYLYCVTRLDMNVPLWWPLLVDKAHTHSDGTRSVLLHSGETETLSKEEWDKLVVKYTDDCMRLTNTRPEFRDE